MSGATTTTQTSPAATPAAAPSLLEQSSITQTPASPAPASTPAATETPAPGAATTETGKPAEGATLIGEAAPKPEAKAEDKAATPAEAPVALTVKDIVLPEGFTADEPLMGKFVDLMNDTKLTPQQRANALVALQSEAVTAAFEKGSAQQAEKQQKWQTELKADPTYGGPKLEASMSKITRLVTAFGSPELGQIFNETTIGDNPVFFRFLVKVADALGEGLPLAGQPGVLAQPKRGLESIYTTHKPQ